MAKKKKLKHKINPEKSNKMIYAVAFGLTILFGVFVAFVLTGDSNQKDDPFLSVKENLEEMENVISVDKKAGNSDVISVVIKEKGKEVMKAIKNEALDLSNRRRKVELEFIVSVSSVENEVYSILVKDAEIVRTKSIVKK